jgi:DNA-binding transcriptional LysR family regulator
MRRTKRGRSNGVTRSSDQSHNKKQTLAVNFSRALVAILQPTFLSKSGLFILYIFFLTYPFLQLSEDQLSRKFSDEYLLEYGEKTNTILRLRNLSQILYSVHRGLGVTICPSLPLFGYDEVPRIQYFSLYSSKGPTTRATGIRYRKDAYQSRTVKDLMTMIHEAFFRGKPQT